jgi:hypothetical protein
MPFTGAHPLAVVPLLRWRWLDATGLVIGSMAPDFQYFVFGHEKGVLGHSMLGLVAWCVPVVVVVGLLFHRVVKWPLLVAAPAAWSRRLVGSATTIWPVRPVAVLVSAVIGGATHDLWDSCTHSEGFIVNRFPGVLRQMVDVPFVDQPMVLFRLLQYACSLVGIVALAVIAVPALRRRAPVDLPADLPRGRVRLVFLVAAAVGCAGICFKVQRYLDGPSSLVVACISGTLYGMVVAGVILRDVGLRARSVSGGRDT